MEKPTRVALRDRKDWSPEAERAAREMARRRLLRFTEYTFPGYVVAPHNVVLAQKLELVERGRIKRLIITMPPRHGKTELAVVRFIPWYLGRHPSRPVIFASYAAALAQAKSRECRDVVESQAFSAVFGELSCVDQTVDVDEGRRRIEAWGIEGHRGGMLATGVGGGITGYGAKLLVIDDPHKNRVEANSASMREMIWGWYGSTARTRLEPGGAVVVIQTRWHVDDLAGKLLAHAASDPRADQWEVLHMPAINAEGEALWPERYSLAELEKIRATIGSWEFEALYQGRPRPLEGALFQQSWFRVVLEVPAGLEWVRYWDLAATVKRSSDLTAGAKVALSGAGTLYVADVVAGRWEWPDVRKVITETGVSDGPAVQIGVEQAMLQVGMIQELRREPRLAAHTIRGVRSVGDKVVRANAWSARAEAGKVALLRGAWNGLFVQEACNFPVGRHDDRVDAVSGAVAMLATGRIDVRWA